MGDKLNEQFDDNLVIQEAKPVLKRPPLYKVILVNDDFTPMDFVCHLLVEVFKKSAAEATRLMLTVHQEGRGIAGIYSKEIAETKAIQAQQYARAEGHPLMATIEAE